MSIVAARTVAALAIALALGARAAFAAAAAPASAASAADLAIDFNRDVRPILSDACYRCHGPDANTRKADLRLDTKEGLFRSADGLTVVSPGKPDASELVRRITTDDRGELMPPPRSGKKLSPREVEILKRWVEQGAPWQGHWAYVVPRRPPVPPAADVAFVRNPIDAFVASRLASAGLRPAPPADRATLVRRVTLDLTGLPPTPAEVAAFVNDASPNAYEKVVDRLLASPHFGERLAVFWLDLVRYADTIGHHSDNPRNVSPYRDYVIASFNANKPFDQFVVEQLAGDLLPEPTLWQRVGSAYNRLLQTTEEGGAQPKEYAAKYLSDRVRNLGSAFLGSTLGCAECHDHKFDPFTMKDFYSLQAFFADVQETPVGKRERGMPVPTGDQAAQLARLDARIADLKRKLESPVPGLAEAQRQWELEQAAAAREVAWQVAAPDQVASANGTRLDVREDGVVVADGTIPSKGTYTLTLKPATRPVTGLRLEALADAKLPASGPGTAENGNFVLTELTVSVGDAPVKLAAKPAATHSQDGFPVADAVDRKQETGWAIFPLVGKDHAAVFPLSTPLAPSDKPIVVRLQFRSPYPRHLIGRLRLSLTDHPSPRGLDALPANVRAALSVPPEKRTEARKAALAAYYRTIAPLLQPTRDALAAAEAEREKLLESVPHVLVTTAGEPRAVRILPRGNWLDDSGEVVQPAIPAFLGSLKTDGRRPNRLDLARWVVSRDNPLTARVFVNRAWKLFFGQGLSKTLEDFGAQGEWPSHPALLDYLAVDFVESGWDVKRLVRQMVTSGTYMQSSTPTPEARERDPDNVLLSRQGRFRLDAEFVRDNALAISGLLVPTIGGESVKPYQPAGYWDYLNFPKRTYVHDVGAKQYRRGLYTHWQRTFLHPSLRAFDAPTREECEANRPRSNIPQQALVLLNDPTYVEAARALAAKMLLEGGDTPEARIAFAFERATARRPSAKELAILKDVLARHAEAYARDPASAAALLKTGLAPVPDGLDPATLAAHASVARVILNLHETITRD